MKNFKFVDLLRDWLTIALGVLLAAHIVDGINYDSTLALVLVVILLSFFNMFLKPILVILSLPFIIVTFGLFLWIINALLFMLAGALIDGFYVESFTSAMLGALIVSLVAIACDILFGGPKRRRQSRARKHDKDDVIDI